MLIDKLIPPNDAGVANWRWMIAIAVVLLLVNGAMGRGFMGIGAYASEHAMVEQGVKIDRLLILQIAQTLRDLKKEECRSNGNKYVILRTIEEYQQQYIEISGSRYPLSQCESS